MLARGTEEHPLLVLLLALQPEVSEGAVVLGVRRQQRLGEARFPRRQLRADVVVGEGHLPDDQLLAVTAALDPLLAVHGVVFGQRVHVPEIFTV